jgi:hypothetical protein
MIDKTEAFQGLVNLAGANIAMGSIRSNGRRLKVAKRKRTTDTASSATLNTQLPHSHSASIMVPQPFQTPTVILIGRGSPARAKNQITEGLISVEINDLAIDPFLFTVLPAVHC